MTLGVEINSHTSYATKRLQ